MATAHLQKAASGNWRRGIRRLPPGTTRALLVIGYVVALVLAGYPYSSHAEPSQSVKRVLLVFAESPEFLAYPPFANSFKAAVSTGADFQCELSYEYLALNRNARNAEYVTSLKNLLLSKYSAARPDLVVLFGGTGAQFMFEHGAEIFPGVPKIVSGAALAGYSETDIPPDFSLVTTTFNALTAARAILKVQPEVKNIYVVIGNSDSEKAIVADWSRQLEPGQEGLSIRFLDNMPLLGLLDFVSRLDSDSVLLFHSFFQDVEGNPYYPVNILRRLYQESHVPIYTSQDSFLGIGPVGGYVVSNALIGADVGKLALEIFSGRGAPKIHAGLSTEYVYDWRELARWKLDDSLLPENSRIEHRAPSFGERYFWPIAGVITLLIVQCAYIAMLLVSRGRRIKVEKALRASTESLQQSNVRISHLNDVLRAIRDVGRIINIEKDSIELLNAVCHSLIQTRGYVTVWIGQPEADSKRLLPKASCGGGTDFLQHAPITWDESPSGQGPAGTAMRERRAVVFDDIATDPRFALWKDPVATYGGASIASVPLIYQERLFGVLTVKADRPHAFGLEEVELLSNLAADLARALQGLESEAARKLAEEAKKESEERLEALAKATFEGIAFIDGGVVIDANPQLAQMHQYDLSELIGKPLADLVAPEGWELARQNVEAGYEGRYENRLLRKDGSTIVVETQAKHFEYRGRTIRVTAVRDISERKRADEVVAREAEMEVQLAQTLEITGAMIWEYRFHEQEYWFDKTACKTFGIEPEDMPISRKIWVERFLHPDDLRNSESVFSRLISDENLAAEIRHRYRNQKTGEWRWVHARAAVSEKDADGRPLRLVGTAMDFTDRHRLEEQLAQSQKLESIGTLAGGIAHDFNNILAAIIGYSEILTLFHIPKDSPARPDLDQVLRAAYRAKDLVGQILILSRKTELEKKPVLVSPIVREALKFLRSTLPATIEIRQSIESDMGKVLADATQIHQVVMNLCTNAGHAMAERGGVLGIRLVEVDLDAPAAEKFPDLDPGPHLRLVVTDTGIGMNRATLERIFEPYFTTKEQGAGTGLGLAVTHGIIKNHRGAITVESEPGKGATFEVLLPRLAAEPIEFAKDASLSIPRGNEHVLFIDDEEAIVNMAKSVLENLGYSVVVETGGNKALDVFRSNPDLFDITITDLTMPGMTGIELAERLKSVRPEIPIILCSGSIDESLREKAKALGINDFLPKPVGVHALAEAVRRVLDKTSEES
ncbi:MAG: PAS domain S-box protein [Syntrophobacteraceae bacterium]